jgi:hypothetical protein
MTHPATLETGTSTFAVHVTGGGSAVNQAKVCLWKGDEVYLTSLTNTSGDATFSVSPSTTGTMFVTTTKIDYIPAEDSASVIWVPNVLTGMATLEILSGPPSDHIISIELRTPGTTDVVATYNAALDDNFAYTINQALGGTYDIALKHANWLRQVIHSVVIYHTTTVDFDLTNGDASDDNRVSLTDLGMVLGNFGVDGPDGDLNWDGHVSLTDLGAVLGSFGVYGDD